MRILLNLIASTSIVAGGSCAGLAKIIHANHTTKGDSLSITNPEFITKYLYDNYNQNFFKNYEAKYHFYDLNVTPEALIFTESNLNFTLTAKGSTSLVKEYLAKHASWGTGTIIMDWLSHNMRDFYNFDDANTDTYINFIKEGSDLGIPPSWWAVPHSKFTRVSGDSDVYSDFEDNLGQPAKELYKAVKSYQAHQAMPVINVRFHYNWHTFIDDDFDVSFQDCYPDTRILW